MLIAPSIQANPIHTGFPAPGCTQDCTQLR